MVLKVRRPRPFGQNFYPSQGLEKMRVFAPGRGGVGDTFRSAAGHRAGGQKTNFCRLHYFLVSRSVWT
jgi:hypothetical protein